MSDNNVGTFRMSPQTRAKFVQVAQQHGLNVASDAGEVTYDGIDFKYNFDTTGTLTIDVVKKPFYITLSVIANHLNNLFMSAQNG